MTEISESQLRREAVEVALWQAPSLQPDAAALSELSRLDSGKQGQVVGNVAVGDGGSLPDLGPLSTFNKWENVASTILAKAADLSGFDPKSSNFDPVAWEGFLSKFSTIPLLLSYTSDIRSMPISKTSLKKVVDATADLVNNLMTPKNFESVLTTIKKMATVMVKNEDRTEKTFNLQVGMLSRHKSVLYLGAIRTSVEMEYKPGKGYEPLQQTLSIYRGYGVLDFDKCKRLSETLLKWDFQDVDDWVKNTNSYSAPPNDSPAWKN